jgi:hypothetical protein
MNHNPKEARQRKSQGIPGKCCRCGKPVCEYERPSAADAATFGLYCDGCLRAAQSWLTGDDNPTEGSTRS